MKSLSSANADTCNNTIYASRQDTTASTDSNRSHDHPEIARIDRHNPLAYARDYIGRGWHVLPLAPTSKDPIEGWQWSKQRVDEQLCEFLFANATNNIGIALGDPSKGLIDIDLDWPEARDIADALISPDLPAFGRETARRTHRLVIATGKSRVEKFRLPTAANTDPRLPDEHCLCVTELRGTGGYTMFPGSIHPNGEAVTWETNCPDVLPERTWDELNHRMGLIAFLAVTVRCYPGRGVRDEFCMALAGTLLRSPLIKEDARIEAVDHLVELVARLAHDEEYRQRRKAQSSWKKMEAGEAVTGFPRMFELLGLPTPVADTLRKWINIGAEADGRPIIDLRSGELKIQLDRAEIALQSAHVPLFQRGRKLVRVIRCDFNAGQTSGIIRQAGSLCIEDVEPYWLSEQLQKAATFKRKEKATKPSHEFCNHLIIGRRGQWRWPVLKAFMETPTLRPDWTVLQEQAYDAATGIFLDFGPTTFGRVPEVPTRQDAEEALAQFVEVIRAFPFAPDEMSEDWSPNTEQGKQPSASRSVILSAWLSGLVRGSLRTVPLHAIDAPVMGTGKSKLADIVSVILTGRPANVISYTPSEEENEKRLFAILCGGDPVIVIDNIEHQLEGAALCSILSQETWKCRVLGKSETPVLGTSALFLATGNNLTVRGDLTRRVVTCRLDARSERPDEREFDFDPVALAREHRVDLVVGGLTILRAYIVAGRPLRGKVPHVGSFEDWTLIREALIWLGHRAREHGRCPRVALPW